MKKAFSLLIAVFLMVGSAHAATYTRGLSIVAKDKDTGQQAEVKLYQKSYAVIIGIDKYQHLPPDKQLHYAVRDAKGVEDVLRKRYRFDKIITLYNEQATREGILKTFMDELASEMGKEDSLVVFWAGHGNQEKTETGDIGYLIPNDGEPNRLYTNISMTQLKEDISKKIPAKHVFYVMDACYSGLLTATRSIDNNPRRDLAYLKEITKETVRQVLTAGGKGQEVLDGGRKGHSVFTGRLIEVLEEAGDFITANEMQAIIKEKVFGDARARNHTQNPAFGTFYGNGDFVFVPSIEQKIRDNRAELTRMEEELKRLEAVETEARKSQDARKQREAEQERKSAEAKLKAEQLKKQQLEAEERNRKEMEEERARFEAEQRKRETELAASRQADEQRLSALKAELEQKKKTAPATIQADNIEMAVKEIKRLNGKIDEIEAAFNRELREGKSRIERRFDTEISAVRTASQTKQQLTKDEFETDSEFQARVQKSGYEERIRELERKKQTELTELERRVVNELSVQTDELRSALRQLAEKQYTLGQERLILEIGTYDINRGLFPVSLKNKMATTSDYVKVAVNGTIPMPREEARKFKQEWQSGLVRAEVTVRANDMEVVGVALVNDADKMKIEYWDGEFLALNEKQQRIEEKRLAGEFVYVKGGCYQMGDTFGDSSSAEKSVHEVCVDSFYMGKYEVTQGQWQAVMENNPSYFKNCGDNCPVEQVSWNDAQDFISKLNSRSGGDKYRLPTEAEWEYAARSRGKSEKYSGGNDIDSVAWYNSNSGNTTHRVGTKASNGLGIYDMSGNVWEWVQDKYDSNAYSNHSRNNPIYEASGAGRVLRGGGWGNDPDDVRASDRNLSTPDNRDDNFGFRLLSTRGYGRTPEPMGFGAVRISVQDACTGTPLVGVKKQKGKRDW